MTNNTLVKQNEHTTANNQHETHKTGAIRWNVIRATKIGNEIRKFRTESSNFLGRHIRDVIEKWNTENTRINVEQKHADIL